MGSHPSCGIWPVEPDHGTHSSEGCMHGSCTHMCLTSYGTYCAAVLFLNVLYVSFLLFLVCLCPPPITSRCTGAAGRRSP